VISARNFDRGDHVRGDAGSADDWLYRLNRLDTLRFVINGTPDLALRLRSDDPATVRFTEFPGRDFPARVAHSSRVFDTATGTMRMELLLEKKLDTATASMAKLWATDMEGKVLDECLQLHGGYGFMWEFPISQAYVDARVTRIYGGTNEIMKEVISRSLGLGGKDV